VVVIRVAACLAALALAVLASGLPASAAERLACAVVGIVGVERIALVLRVVALAQLASLAFA
jgi:hypothetical protein